MKTLNYLKTIGLITAILFTSCSPPENDEQPLPNIDLAAVEISFSIDKTSEFSGTATITGSIKNIGDHFRSGQGQQSIYLYERTLGTPTDQSGELVAQLDFTEIASGESKSVSFNRLWSASSPAEGEFPPEYILVISYDPDILIDSNVQNDDTNFDNDRLLESGIGINDLF